MDLPKLNETETLIGYVETDTGGITIVDSLWDDHLPKVTQNRVILELGLDKCKIPVYGFKKDNKRYLLISLDDSIDTPSIEGVVPIDHSPSESDDS